MWRSLVAFGLVTAVAPVVAASPASADPAPLVTEDAIGIRLDENAIQGDVLEAIETALQPTVDTLIFEGAEEDAPISSYEDLNVSSNLELSFDVVAPGGAHPDGAIDIHADIHNIEIEYVANAWWHPRCSIFVRPSDATIDVTAEVDPTAWPNTPVDILPASATWDDDPSVSVSFFACWGYLIDDFFSGWWNDFIGNDPESTASRIEAQIDGVAQDLLDDLWGEHVTPVIDSLNEFGIDLGQLYTDDHGLIVTADLDATGGLTIPGLGGPFDVSGAEDSGADTDVNALLANRTTDDGPVEVIVTVDPNVGNQFLHGLHNAVGGNMGAPTVSDSIEDVLLLPAHQGLYLDGFWSMSMSTPTAFYLEPTGPGGAPQLRIPDVELEVYNILFDAFNPVATFEGEMTGIDLVTVEHDDDTWGPTFDSSNASLSVTRTQANAHASQVPPQASSAILPYAQVAFDNFNDDIVVEFVSLAPIAAFDFTIELCTECGRFDNDERYTENFKVN